MLILGRTTSVSFSATRTMSIVSDPRHRSYAESEAVQELYRVGPNINRNAGGPHRTINTAKYTTTCLTTCQPSA